MDCTNVRIGMKNFACFNELSVRPLCTSEASVDQRIRNFLKMLKEVRNHTHITKVRLEGEMTSKRPNLGSGLIWLR